MSNVVPRVVVVGGGMIVNDQILPSLYHLQRVGKIGEITIVDKSPASLRALKESDVFKSSFPGQSFVALPPIESDPAEQHPGLYKEHVSKMEPGQLVVVALPDQMHDEAIRVALEHDQHVLSVKPLVLRYSQAIEIEAQAREKGLFIGIEYHKRFDRRSLLARKHYAAGDFGEFIAGESKLIEPWYYRRSNFQNWFTCENTDPFVYVGCHYVDLIQFITGLKPVEVSVKGTRGRFPNGNEAFMWSSGRVVYENGAILTCINGLGYPDEGAGSNEQCLSMYFEGAGKTGHLRHNDQFRGVEYSFLGGIGPGGSTFNYVNPDYYRLVPWQGTGLKPTGYGYDSIEAIVDAMISVASAGSGLPSNEAVAARKNILEEIDQKRIIATPANSCNNELVMEAARLSILAGGKPVYIHHGASPRVEPSWNH